MESSASLERPPAPDGPTIGWTQAPLPFRVWQNMSPPLKERLDPDTYAGFPLTDVICRHPSAAHSQCSAVRISQLIWDNRAVVGSDGCTLAWNQKPNPLCLTAHTTGGMECRVQFSTQGKAMAATHVQLAHACGASWAQCRTIAAAAGFSANDLMAWAEVARDANALDAQFSQRVDGDGEAYAVCRDKIVLAPWRLPDCINGNVWGLIIDLENQDGRSETDQFDHVDRLVSTAHAAGLKIGFFLNALNSALSRKFNGCTPDLLHTLHQRSDMIWLALGSKNPECGGALPQQWANQIEELAGHERRDRLDPAKLGVNFELGVAPGGTTLDDALDAHRIVASQGLGGGVWVWRNGAKLGPQTDAFTRRKLIALYHGVIVPA